MTDSGWYDTYKTNVERVHLNQTACSKPHSPARRCEDKKMKSQEQRISENKQNRVLNSHNKKKWIGGKPRKTSGFQDAFQRCAVICSETYSKACKHNEFTESVVCPDRSSNSIFMIYPFIAIIDLSQTGCVTLFTAGRINVRDKKEVLLFTEVKKKQG